MSTHRFTLIFSFVLTIILASILNNIYSGGDHWRRILKSDARGYYAHLPAQCIYSDHNYGFFDQIEREKYYVDYMFYDYRSVIQGDTLNKYFCGVAFCQFPLFAIAHLYASLSAFDADGFSKPYIIAICLSSLLFCFLGLYAVGRLLSYYTTSKWMVAVCVVSMLFGTHLFYYSIIEPGMSHIYSFGLISYLLLILKQTFDKNKSLPIFRCIFLLGLITLIRPTNVLIVFFIPFLIFDSNGKWVYPNRSVQWSWHWIGGLILFLTILFPQGLLYKMTTGSYFIYAYHDEGFRFADPQILNLLFSYKKGLFLYTPILLIASVGLFFIWKQNKWMGISWLFFFGIITYVFSSWWMWYYGGSFSARVYVEFLLIFFILMAITLKKVEHVLWRRLYLTLIFLCIVLCQIQTYQYRYHQIHWSEMNKERYWDVFLRIDKLI